MTYEQYWYGDPLMVRAFYKAEKIRQERMNTEAWLNGAYVFRALSATIGNAFKKKSEDPINYPAEPIPLGENKNALETERQEEQNATFAKAYMLQMMQVGKNWGKR